MLRPSSIVTFAAVLLYSASGFAQSPDAHIEPVKKVLPDIVSAIVQDDLVEALRAANRKRNGMTQAEIDRIEATWQREIDSSNRPLIDSVVENSIAARMRQVIAQRGDLITEIGVIDAAGLSIAQSAPNSDIWQGDEPKWQKTYLVGANAVFIDEVEFDSSTQSMQSQANFTVADPTTGKPIGAVTVGINVDTLM